MAVGTDDPWRAVSDGYRQGPPRASRADRGHGERGLSFADDLIRRIRTSGPLTVDAYMAACNAHYYATRDPLGSVGDFITAPEIHQMFGELVGACLANAWHRAGAPGHAIYVELGPGRGTLAVDALRVLGDAVEAHFVETSPALRDAQRARLPGAAFYDRIEQLPPRPMLLVANEFLDALPVRQWVGDEQRLVIHQGTGLAFSAHGMIVEDSPARDSAVTAVAAHLVRHGGVALLIDYGHFRRSPGDTLQAVRTHRFADPLADPGEQDLTAHVDFEAIADSARNAGATVTAVISQGEWLRRLGIDQRGQALALANSDRAGEVEIALARLTGADQMGDLFKVIALHSPEWPAPAGFE